MKHKFFRQAGIWILCFALALSLAALPASAAEGDGTGNGGTGTETGGTGDNTGGSDAVTKLELDPTSFTLSVGASRTINVDITPEDAEVSWASSDTKVATVTDGEVTGVSAGTVTITASAGDKSTNCIVTVKNVLPVRSIDFTSSEILKKDADKNQRSISVEITPPGADYKGISFSSDAPAVVSIDADDSDTTGRNAVLTFGSPGETYVHASVVDAEGISTRCKITVSGIVLSDTSKRLVIGTSENLSLDTYGEARNITKIDWYSDNNTIVSVANGRLTPHMAGTARVTAMRGNYSASCEVTVVEDTSRLIIADGSVPAGTPMSFREIREDIDDVCREKTGRALNYITSLSVTPAQGILYHGYISEADTGSGVSMTERYYYSSSNTDDYLINDLTFVPRSTFSGNAEISYTAVATNNTTVSGVIRVAVDAMEDVSYTTGSGQNVFFLGSDFNTVCRARTGRELSAVTFTLPSSSRGTLYLNYTSDKQYAEKVEANTKYRRNGNPNLDSVSFLPAEGFTGSVRISYRGEDTAGGSFTGYVTVTVTDRGTNGDSTVRFTGRAGREVTFTASRFNTACREATGEYLDYVQFKLPDNRDGTLYYTSGSTERKVTENTYCYRNGTPSLGSVSFVPASSAPEQVRIAFTGRSTGGTNFKGTVLIDYGGTGSGTQAIRYSVFSGRAVQFEAADFNSECIAATGSTLDYVRFELPPSAQGLLCYDYSSTSGRITNVNNSTRYYRTGTGSNRLDRVYFLADSRYTGSVAVNYTGYSTNGESFNGTVTVQVNSLSPAEVTFSGSGSQPIAMSSTQIRNACNAVLEKDLSYIQFTSLPSSSVGRLYRDYNGFETGSQVVTGTQYYVSGSPSIDQLSFVPRGGFSGTAVVTYIGVSTSGEQVSGRINFVVSSSGYSGYFNDMGAYSWATAAADYLYQNGVISGIGNGQYGPGQNIRRADFVLMLCRAYRFSDVGTDSGFADVPQNSYYASAVATGSYLGIVSGDGTNFRPNDHLTRQDAMVIIKRTLQAAGWSLGGGSTAELSAYNDGGSVASYAQDAVSTLVRLGAVKGDNNGNLRPWDPINRAEVAVILHFVMTM